MSNQSNLTNAHRNRSWGRDLAIILTVALAARVGWLLIMPTQAKSSDMKSWVTVSNALRDGTDPYQTSRLNYAPFWMEVIYGINRITGGADYDVMLCIRLLLIVADLILIAACWMLFLALSPPIRGLKLFLCGFSLNPLFILLTVQHANFDAIPMIWVVLFLLFLVKTRKQFDPVTWLCAAMFLGIAVWVKTFPLVLWPLLIPGVKQVKWNARILAAFLVVGPYILSLAPLYVLEPAVITKYVLNYRGISGFFAVSAILKLSGQPQAMTVYSHLFTIALGVALFILAARLWRKDLRRPVDIVLLPAMILLSLFALGPGYGAQYWFWVAPLLVIAYPFQSPSFRKVLLICGCIIVVTNIIDHAMNPSNGGFLYWWFPTNNMATLGNSLLGRNGILLFIPMGIACWVLLAFGTIAILSKRNTSVA